MYFSVKDFLKEFTQKTYQADEQKIFIPIYIETPLVSLICVGFRVVCEQ